MLSFLALGFSRSVDIVVPAYVATATIAVIAGFDIAVAPSDAISDRWS